MSNTRHTFARHHWLVAWIVAGSMGLALTSANPLRAQPRQSPPPAIGQPHLTLPKGATLETTVRALDALSGSSTAAPRVVVADVSGAAATLKEPVDRLPLTEAFDRISLELDRFWVSRGKGLALQLRYSDPQADPGLEIEELRATAEDLIRLLGPLAPRLSGIPYIRAKQAFVASITPEQQERMLKGGLPFHELSPGQQGAWMEINSAKAYGQVWMEGRRLLLCLTQWKSLTARDLAPERGRRHALFIPFPDPADDDGENACTVQHIWTNRRPRQLRPEGAMVPAAKPPAGALRERWDVPAQETDLAALVKKLADAGGPSVEIPDYAQGRRFWIFSHGGTRAEVLGSLADLWGWELAPKGNGYRLGRPRLGPASGPVDLYQKVRWAIPPGMWHQLQGRYRDHGTQRPGVQMDLVYEAADKAAGADWLRFRIAQLDPEAQRRLANQVALSHLSPWRSQFGADQVPAWIQRPQEGVFTLSGPLGPEQHPELALMFGSNGGWGWSVGTSSLDK